MYQVFKPLKKNTCLLVLFFCIANNLLWAQRVDSSLTISVKEIKHIAKGDFLYSMGSIKYEYAVAEYLKALTTNPDNYWLNYKVGFCYLNIPKLRSRSIPYLEKAALGDTVKNKDTAVKIRYHLGKAYELNHNPEKAIDEYRKYIIEINKRLIPDTTEIATIRKQIDVCKNLADFYSHPVKVKLKNMGDSINSPYAEYDPFVTSDDSTMYFTSRRPDTKGGGKAEVDNEYYEDIYVSHRKHGKWQRARKVLNLNKSTNDAITGLSADGLTMFIYRDVNDGDIFISHYGKRGWSKPKNIKELNTNYHESSASLASDGKTVYFVSDRPGGEGGRDIYSSVMEENGKWRKPVNLGPEVNTTFDEDRASIDSDGKTLYFSSKGHNSIGGFDIFKSTYENGKWSTPENLGYPINDVDDDFSFIKSADGRFGYYSSLKDSGKGDKDIYFIDFLLPPPPIDSSKVPLTLLVNKEQPLKSDSLIQTDSPLALINTTFKDSNQINLKHSDQANLSQTNQANLSQTDQTNLKQTDQANLSQTNQANLKQTDQANLSQTDQTNLKQTDQTNLKQTDQANLKQTDQANLSQTNQLNDTHLNQTQEKSNPTLQLQNQNSLNADASLINKSKDKIKDTTKPDLEENETSDIEITDSSLFHNILFEFNKQTFNEDGRIELDRLVTYMNKHTFQSVKATGHADAVGGDAYNLILSQKRAMQVSAYLVSKGIKQNRIKVDYKGKSRPVEPNNNPDNSDNPDGRRLNRRVELEIFNK